MPYRGDAFTQGQYCHIYNRGAGKGKIFFNDGNYQYLLRLVKEYYRKYGATIIAYCLMPIETVMKKLANQEFEDSKTFIGLREALIFGAEMMQEEFVSSASLRDLRWGWRGGSRVRERTPWGCRLHFIFMDTAANLSKAPMKLDLHYVDLRLVELRELQSQTQDELDAM